MNNVAFKQVLFFIKKVLITQVGIFFMVLVAIENAVRSILMKIF